MHGTYDTKTRQLHCEAVEYTCLETPTVLAFYDGVASPLLEEMIDHVSSGDRWQEEMLGSGITDWMQAFLGPFQLILYDKRFGDLLITQHLFGNGKTLYLQHDDQTLRFASSLRELRTLLQQPFELNVQMLPHYFYNGFIAGSHTLVAGVYKLEASTSYLIKDGTVYKKRIAFDESAPAPAEETDALVSAYEQGLTGSIDTSVRLAGEPIALALSGGFNSNCTLYRISQQFPEISVQAYSVGGCSGVDETETAASIASQYEHVTFCKSMVTPETLTHLDEIVEILEGSVYERGVFLQYELSQLLRAHHVHHMICGECADQVFHTGTYQEIPEDTFLYGYRETPLQMAVYAVLKKSRMMLNAQGIQGVYPFLAPRMVEVGFASRGINGPTKEFHKAQCRKILPPAISSVVGKQGGSTDLAPLFPEGFDCEQEIQKRKYYSPDFMITRKFDHDEALRDYYLSLVYLESFERQFCY